MTQSNFIEDIFLEFFQLCLSHDFLADSKKFDTIYSFHDTIINGTGLTEKQRKYLLIILKENKQQSFDNGLDYQDRLQDPKWRLPLRIIDKSKRVWIESSDELICVNLKFPFELREDFDKNIESYGSIWESKEKIRKIPIYNLNLIQLNEFLLKHNFEIDESFNLALSEYEEIWQNYEYRPYAIIENEQVKLINANEDTLNFWNENFKNDLPTDLILAKTMGYYLENPSSDVFQKISSVEENLFWIKDCQKVLNIFKKINGKCCIILDRVPDTFEWLKNFIKETDLANIPRSMIKVCFREDSSDSKLNVWIKENNLGGSVASGDMFIFLHKPSKWLFKEKNSVKMLIINSLYPPTDKIVKDWINYHPFVIHLTDIKPSNFKEQKIVEL